MKHLALAIAMEAVYQSWFSYATRRQCVAYDTEFWNDVIGVYCYGTRHVI